MHYLIFAGLGPLIGLACIFVAIAIDSGNPFGGKLTDASQVTAWFTTFAYIFGLPPALVAGWVVRQVQNRQARPEWVWVTLMGIGIGLIFVVAFGAVLEWLIPSGRSIFEIGIKAFLIHVPTCLIATLICWRLSRRLAKPAKQTVA